jgi:hypothetical protein
MKSVSLLAIFAFLHVAAFAQCPTITGTVTNATCNNYKNGGVNISVTGGSGSYTFNWSNLSTAEDLQNVYAGNYTVTVKDANGCTVSKTFTIAQPDEVLISTVTVNPSCAGGSNGSITPSATGGSGSYTFTRFTGGSTFTGLPAGTYELIATDTKGCIGRTTVSLTAPEPIQIFSISTEKYLGYDLSCAGGSNGQITINAAGGTGSLQYAIQGSTFQASPVLTGLSAGTYVVTVKDQNGCTLSNDYETMVNNPGIIISPPVTLMEPPQMELSPIIVNPYQLIGGVPNVLYIGYGPQWVVLSAGEVIGGTGETFSYQWTNNTGAPMSNPNEEITQSIPAQTTTYTLIATDNNGCTATTQVTIKVVDARCTVGNNQNQKIVLCHNGTEICVSMHSLFMSQHLAHGDKVGPCVVSTQSTSKRIDEKVVADEAEVSVEKMIEVHPNPSVGRFNVALTPGDRTEIQVLNGSGVVIESRTGGAKNIESFDLSGKPAGLYYIRTISAQGVKTTKVWIQR